ncbi:hypothetical protein BD324DRAFT_648129 [Kockovaella imperatae]|uniref:Uncharacterized protein n=1 Tax=Kockovaella imperatae TaxID=4999 RepID=A0A1Y1UT95_9TREE|nr:hypothetical protein BD324DRAFT_648129 [Kockovaella imperatae]ORX41249.1 hypothetical protein BD324DRAFT_648129 [Kockovaella imperatae]
MGWMLMHFEQYTNGLYSLSHLVRSSIHIRSFKASFDPSAQSQSSRHLSAISYSQPSAQGNNSSSVKDDTTYLFLENKGDSSESEPQPRDKYKILAVKPSAVPLALLQNLMNPFVMGLSKSAKSAASATATQSSLVPTPLPGQSLLITSFAFPPLSPPGPQMVVTVHSLPAPTASSIFLEIEHGTSKCSNGTHQKAGGKIGRMAPREIVESPISWLDA